MESAAITVKGKQNDGERKDEEGDVYLMETGDRDEEGRREKVKRQKRGESCSINKGGTSTVDVVYGDCIVKHKRLHVRATEEDRRDEGENGIECTVEDGEVGDGEGGAKLNVGNREFVLHEERSMENTKSMVEEDVTEVVTDKWKTHVSPLTDASFMTDEEKDPGVSPSYDKQNNGRIDDIESPSNVVTDSKIEKRSVSTSLDIVKEGDMSHSVLDETRGVAHAVDTAVSEPADTDGGDKSPIFTEEVDSGDNTSSDTELLTPDDLLGVGRSIDETQIESNEASVGVDDKGGTSNIEVVMVDGVGDLNYINHENGITKSKEANEEDGTTSETRDDVETSKSIMKKNHNSLLDGCLRVELFRKLNKISEGTYGAVYRAENKETGELVALKQIKYNKNLFEEGFPITSLREISIMLELNHINIVLVKEVVVGQSPLNVFMVMEYVEHELKTLLEGNKPEFSISEKKCLLLQLLRAVDYLHKNWVIHRDLKTSNLLYNNKGILKLCDFGMARKFGDPIKPYTHNVVTLWYRAPELILGQKKYTQAVDIWSVGCIFGELILKKPLFPGHGEEDQLKRIIKLCGSPKEAIWPAFSELPAVKNRSFKFGNHSPTWRDTFPVFLSHYSSVSGSLSDAGLDLLQRLLELCPEKRISAAEALQHPYFQTEKPAPQPLGLMPTVPDTNSQVRKRKHIDKELEIDEKRQLEAYHDGSFRFGERVDAEMFLSQLDRQSQKKTIHETSKYDASIQPTKV